MGGSFYNNLEAGILTFGRAKNSHSNLLIKDVKAYRYYSNPIKTSNLGNGIVIGNFYPGTIEYCTAFDNGENNLAKKLPK